MELVLSNFNSIGNAMGWTLIHFLWQGLLLFVSYWIITRLFLKRKITQQYWVGMFFITLCLVVPIREFITQLNLSNANDGIIQLLNNNISAEYTTGIINPLDLSLMLLHKIIPYLVVFWMVSVLLISSHLFQSWLALLKLSKETSFKLPDTLLKKLEKVASKLKLKVTPIISISEKIDIPATFGFFKPVILLPLSLISKIPNEQMEAILIHELCHIKRADFLHNILQLLVETLFFYHPLSNWVSRDIRKIREQCCDEMVLDLEANPIVYANALTNIASIYNKHNSHDRSHLQIAASDGELFDRIKVLMLEKRSKSPVTNILLGVLFTTLFLVMFNNIVTKPNDIFTPHASIQTASTAVNSTQKAERPVYETPNIYDLFNQKKTTKILIVNPSTNQAPIVKPDIVRSIPPKIQKLEVTINTLIPITESQDSEITKPVNTEEKLSIDTHANIPVLEPNLLRSKTNLSEKSFPKIIKKINPIYTKFAQSKGIEGTVILSFMINEKGKVKNINIDKRSPLKLLDISARSALRKWRFDPKSINQNNFQKRYQQIFSFKIDKIKQCIPAFTGSRIANTKNCKITKH